MNQCLILIRHQYLVLVSFKEVSGFRCCCISFASLSFVFGWMLFIQRLLSSWVCALFCYYFLFLFLSPWVIKFPSQCPLIFFISFLSKMRRYFLVTTFFLAVNLHSYIFSFMYVIYLHLSVLCIPFSQLSSACSAFSVTTVFLLSQCYFSWLSSCFFPLFLFCFLLARRHLVPAQFLYIFSLALPLMLKVNVLVAASFLLTSLCLVFSYLFLFCFPLFWRHMFSDLSLYCLFLPPPFILERIFLISVKIRGLAHYCYILFCCYLFSSSSLQALSRLCLTYIVFCLSHIVFLVTLLSLLRLSYFGFLSLNIICFGFVTYSLSFLRLSC